MPDNAESGSATQGAGPATTPAASTPAAGGGDPIEQRLKAMEKMAADAKAHSEANAKNLRSIVDRSMAEMRQMLQQSQRTIDQQASDPAFAPAAPHVSPDADAERQERAIIRFRQEYPDWQDWWDKITAITGDAAKAAPYVYYKPDGSIDYYRSLKEVREDLELQELRAQRVDLNKAQAEQEGLRNQLLRDATISGGSSSTPAETDWSKLSADDKVRKLVELGLVDYDPEDPPAALRKR